MVKCQTLHGDAAGDDDACVAFARFVQRTHDEQTGVCISCSNDAGHAVRGAEHARATHGGPSELLIRGVVGEDAGHDGGRVAGAQADGVALQAKAVDVDLGRNDHNAAGCHLIDAHNDDGLARLPGLDDVDGIVGVGRMGRGDGGYDGDGDAIVPIEYAGTGIGIGAEGIFLADVHPQGVLLDLDDLLHFLHLR